METRQAIVKPEEENAALKARIDALEKTVARQKEQLRRHMLLSRDLSHPIDSTLFDLQEQDNGPFLDVTV